MMTPEDANARNVDDVDACVFDCDGTLIDTMGLFYAADVKACEEVGVTMSKEVFYALAGVPIRDIFARLCREQGVEMTDEALDAMVESCGKHARALGTPRAIECVVEIAREAKRRGKAVAVASSGVKTTVERHLREHGLLANENEKNENGKFLFDVVVTCEDVARGKPAPDLYLLAAERLGVSPARCVAYEDADLGMESARAAGYKRVVDVRLMSEYHPTDYLCREE